MTDNFYNAVCKAKDLDSIENIMRDFDRDFLCNYYDKNKTPVGAPQSPEHAYLAKKLAFFDKISPDKQIKWQNYWFRCCISDKCNFIFSILSSKKICGDARVNREDDLAKICNPAESKILHKLDEETMKGYLDAGIDFFLKRYNVWGAWRLYNKYPSKWNINFIKLLLPRMFSAILIGFIPIVTSGDIKGFVSSNSSLFFVCTISNLWIYSFCMAILSFAYISFECRKTTRDTQVASEKRSALVFAIGMAYSLFFSVIFAKIGLLGEDLHLADIIFYAIFAFLIGILLQLLWEEKTTTEPL